MGEQLAQSGAIPQQGPDPQMMALAQKLRAVDQGAQGLAAEMPFLAEEAQQISQLLKQMAVKAAQMMSAQTASGMAVPGGGGGM
jgi:hypothetical protein